MGKDDDTLGAEGVSDPIGVGLAPGRRVADRYVVEALLGRGGMGAVYRVRDEKLDEIVALKVLTLSTEQAAERFLREVKLARRVTHPNVARTHDLGEHEGLRFLTMELVRGRSLDDALDEGGPLPPAEVVRLGDAIAAGLEAAHAAGVVHRDLKPANVLLADDGRVVLTDFGIARATERDPRAKETGGVVGTPYYMAPEQVLGREVDARADLYALGVMLFELLTGRLPFEADTPIAVALMRVHEDPPDPRALAPVPDALAALVLACLARAPGERPASATEVRAALTGARPSIAPSPAPAYDLSTPTGSSLYAPISPGRRALAVLPFVYRGDAAHDSLGEGLAEELIDVLSRTRGLRVLALGATRRFADARDPARLGGELGADGVVDGTVQVSGDRVRITARLVETDSGLQRWSERFDGHFADVFALQETMGRRIAEALRLEVDAAAHRNTAPQEAIELYLRARQLLRTGLPVDALAAEEHLARVLTLAPGFTLAYPAAAMASLRAWWIGARDQANVRGERAREQVERAVERAPDVAETHLARALLSAQLGEYRACAQALARALEIAPTLAEAHAYLSELQVEAGRVKEGARRQQLALELNPSSPVVRVSMARLAALEGDFGAARAHLAFVEEYQPTPTLSLTMSLLRHAIWGGDRARAGALLERVRGIPGDAPRGVARLVGFGLGESSLEEAQVELESARSWLVNPRFTSLMLQVGTESLAAGGAHAEALDTLVQAAEGALIDVDWLRRCPVLAPLRESPRFVEALAKVERRAAEIWEG